MTICEKKKHTSRNAVQMLKGLIKQWRKEKILYTCSHCNRATLIDRLDDQRATIAYVYIRQFSECTAIKECLEEKEDES